MKRPRLKICGITSIEDAFYCAEKGVDYLGFIFYPGSPRCVDIDNVTEISRKLEKEFPEIIKVGVFVNEDPSVINHIIENTGINMVQLHGDEPRGAAAYFKKSVIKAFRVKGSEDVISAIDYDADYILFDTYQKGTYGGTGNVFNWELLDLFPDKNRIFLSGGLDSGNIKEAVMRVSPFAVDLSSSLEASPGIKDKKKVDDFFNEFYAI